MRRNKGFGRSGLRVRAGRSFEQFVDLYKTDPARYGRDAGRYTLRFEVARARLFQGSYTVRAFLSDRRTNAMFDELHGICPFEVTMDGVARDDYPWTAGDCTYLESAAWTLTHGADRAAQRGTVAP